jgi:hypothetical protein
MFNCRLVRRNQYLFGESVNQPDMIHGANEICRLWLNANSRARFHEVLRMCLEAFLIVKDNDNNLSLQQSKAFLHELSTQEDKPYYLNDQAFDCITCFDTVASGEGILFRNCLHPFCKPCLLRLIETSSEPTVKCPHDNCSAFIEERELRGVRIE